MADHFSASNNNLRTDDEISRNTNEKEDDKNTNTLYIKSGTTSVKVVEHFSGDQTYTDIIKTALRREFSE